VPTALKRHLAFFELRFHNDGLVRFLLEVDLQIHLAKQFTKILPETTPMLGTVQPQDDVPEE
jgi:hypothetical protein